MAAVNLVSVSDSIICQYYTHPSNSIYRGQRDVLINELKCRGVSPDNCVELTGSVAIYASSIPKPFQTIPIKVKSNQIPNTTKPKLKTKPSPKLSPKSAKSGSGFFVSKIGSVITNQHIVDKCTKVTEISA